MIGRGEVRVEVRDVRNYPRPPGPTAAVVTEAAAAVVTGALWSVEMLTRLRHCLGIDRGSGTEQAQVRGGREIGINLVCLLSSHLGSTELPELGRVMLNTVPRRLDLKISLS